MDTANSQGIRLKSSDKELVDGNYIASTDGSKLTRAPRAHTSLQVLCACEDNNNIVASFLYCSLTYYSHMHKGL